LQSVKVSGDRILKVSIAEYNFDIYTNGKVGYEVNNTVFDNNNVLAEDAICDTVVIKGSVWTGSKKAFERKIPEIYQSIIRKIIRENDKITTALK